MHYLNRGLGLKSYILPNMYAAVTLQDFLEAANDIKTFRWDPRNTFWKIGYPGMALIFLKNLYLDADDKSIIIIEPSYREGVFISVDKLITKKLEFEKIKQNPGRYSSVELLYQPHYLDRSASVVEKTVFFWAEREAVKEPDKSIEKLVLGLLRTENATNLQQNLS